MRSLDDNDDAQWFRDRIGHRVGGKLRKANIHTPTLQGLPEGSPWTAEDGFSSFSFFQSCSTRPTVAGKARDSAVACMET